MIRVGFAKIDFEKALRPANPIREERIEAISFCVLSESLNCVWVTLDFMDFNLQVVNTLKRKIHEKTQMELDHIHIVTTHNHGGGKPDLQTLAVLTAECAEHAIEAAVPAFMRWIKCVTNRQLNYVRRVWVPELSGVTTLYFGASEENGYNSAPFVERAISDVRQGELNYCGRKETDRGYAPFPVGDDEVVAVQFCDENQQIIGTIARFAAHAVCCNRAGSFSSDYPYHVRKGLEAKFGGVAVFFNGPCGDIAPGMKDKYDGSQTRLGGLLAELVIDNLEKATFEPITSFQDMTHEVELPVRQELIDKELVISAEMPLELSERRCYLEKKFLEKMFEFLKEKHSVGEESPREKVDVSLGFLEINNFVFVAFPGESFSITGKALQKAFPEKTICTVTEHGRTVMYLPPQEDGERGGYESVCRVTELGAEKLLRDGAIDAMNKFLKQDKGGKVYED